MKFSVLAVLVGFFVSANSFAAPATITLSKSARPVDSVKSVGISGEGARELYDSLSDIEPKKVEGVSGLIRESSDIQCIKGSNKKNKPTYECYFDLSTAGAVMSPRTE